MSLQIDVDGLAQVLERLRKSNPVVHVITNWVTAGDVANALHAISARPVMAIALEEVEDVVSKADALVLNLGTPDPSRVKAMLLAGHKANRLGRPVIFRPRWGRCIQVPHGGRSKHPIRALHHGN